MVRLGAPASSGTTQACRRARSHRERARQTRSRAGADAHRQRPPHCSSAQQLGCLPAAASTRSMACLAAAATSCSPASATSARRRSSAVAACAASSAASAAAAAARAACRATLAASLARLCAACAASSTAAAAHGRAAPARPPAAQPARASPHGRRLPRSNSARWSVARDRQVRHLQRHPRHASNPRPACTRMTTASWPTSGAFARARVGLALRAVSAALRGQAQLAPRQLPLLHQLQLPLHRRVPRRLLGCEVGRCPVQPRRVPVLACRAAGARDGGPAAAPVPPHALVACAKGSSPAKAEDARLRRRRATPAPASPGGLEPPVPHASGRVAPRATVAGVPPPPSGDAAGPPGRVSAHAERPGRHHQRPARAREPHGRAAWAVLADGGRPLCAPVEGTRSPRSCEQGDAGLRARRKRTVVGRGAAAAAAVRYGQARRRAQGARAVDGAGAGARSCVAGCTEWGAVSAAAAARLWWRGQRRVVAKGARIRTTRL